LEEAFDRSWDCQMNEADGILSEHYALMNKFYKNFPNHFETWSVFNDIYSKLIDLCIVSA
jgi:hypothetical protein